ncbi:MAG: hypothetical protein ACMG6E_02455 [Candidatus Roizmanbacteria bacterium]
MITYEDFSKLDIRMGTVLSAEKAEGTDKLLKIIFDLGTEERQILTAMAEHFADPSIMIGKQMPVLVNIAPREIRGLTSHGMIIAAETDEGEPILLQPEKSVPNGSKVM